MIVHTSPALAKLYIERLEITTADIVHGLVSIYMLEEGRGERGDRREGERGERGEDGKRDELEKNINYTLVFKIYLCCFRHESD